MDITDLFALGVRVGDKLVARGETIAVAESSAGGLISAALLARAGASAYYFGGAVLYTRRSGRLLTTLTADDSVGMRSSSPPWAQLLARHQRTRFRASWGLAETGAAGPTGNPYGDPAGHSCLAVDGPMLRERLLRTGLDDRPRNMVAFAMAALTLLEQAIDAAPAIAAGTAPATAQTTAAQAAPPAATDATQVVAVDTGSHGS
ncbi:MAG: CinA family protein [Microbacteriaceae bacterium]|nr:CinA family protein [Burkholderiaceae bacterium]